MSEQTQTPINDIPDASTSPSRREAMAEVLAQMEQGIEEETPESTDDADADDADADDADVTEDAESDDAEESGEEPAPDEDAELAKKLETIQRSEARAKEAVAKERELFEAERAKQAEAWKDQERRIQAFEDAQKQAKYDPAGYLASLGIDKADDLMAAARQLYAMAKGDEGDPMQKRIAQQTLRERQQADEVARVRKELEDLRSEMAKEREQVESQRKLEEYLGQVSKAIDAETSPLIAKWHEKAPDKVRRRLHEMAYQIAEQTGEPPEPADVVKALERARRGELEELGLDPGSVLSTKTEDKTQSGTKKRKAKTLSSDLGNPKSPREAPLTRAEQVAEVQRMLESGQIE